jgi:hypothetical protein
MMTEYVIIEGKEKKAWWFDAMAGKVEIFDINISADKRNERYPDYFKDYVYVIADGRNLGKYGKVQDLINTVQRYLRYSI